jgi:SUMO ligase MMS21 Smc5/6 complex component
MAQGTAGGCTELRLTGFEGARLGLTASTGFVVSTVFTISHQTLAQLTPQTGHQLIGRQHALNAIDRLAILEQQQRGESRNLVFRGQLGVLRDVLENKVPTAILR